MRTKAIRSAVQRGSKHAPKVEISPVFPTDIDISEITVVKPVLKD
jgi:hypothetical protein